MKHGTSLGALDYPLLPLVPAIDHERLHVALRAALDESPDADGKGEWIWAVAAWHHLRCVCSGVRIEPTRLVATWNIDPQRWLVWEAFLFRAQLVRRNRRVNRFDPGDAWPGAFLARQGVSEVIDLREPNR